MTSPQHNSAMPGTGRAAAWRPTPLFWVVSGVLGFMLLISIFSRSFWATLAVVAVIVGVTAFLSLKWRRPTWLALRSPKESKLAGAGAAALCVGAIALAAATGGQSPADGAAPAKARVTASAAQTPSASPTPTPTSSPMPTDTPTPTPTPIEGRGCKERHATKTHEGETYYCENKGKDLAWLTKADYDAVQIERAEREAAKQAAEEEAARIAAEEAAAKAAEEEAARLAAEQAENAAEQGSVYYENCTAARAAGAAPVHVGDPGYGEHLDRDGDGVGCE